MPPRKPAGSTGHQSTLSFNTRVTKAVPKSAKDSAAAVTPSLSPVVKKEDEDEADAKPTTTVKSEASQLVPKLEDIPDIKAEAEVEPDAKKVKAEIKDEVKEEQDVKVKLEDEAKPSSPVEKSEVELRAEKITDSQIRRYWRLVESERLSKRVHQEDLDVSEKVLRYFDVCSHYGPCTGLSRLKRWQRAERLGLTPPIEVLAILLRNQEESAATGGRTRYERAHIDEILNPLPVEVVAPTASE